MNQLLILSNFVVMLGACGADEAIEQASGSSATGNEEKPSWKRNSRKREPKWVMAVEGLPVLSGITVTAVGSIEGGIFSLGSSKLTASITLTSEGETPNIMMTFKEQKVRCPNYGAVVPNVDGTRVGLSGEVECKLTNGDKPEPRKAQISGWFETAK